MGDVTSETARALVGVTLPGKFRIDEEIASGAFATVFRARQLAVDRDVAVKVVHHGVDALSEDGRLFVQEIQAVGRIDHPNVVRVHQADVTADGRLFFAMEWLDGRDLQAILDEGTVPLARARGWMRQLLAALGAAHDAGLVHADVKPANVIVVGDGERERVVLVDFGLARLRRAGGSAASVGGTPAYMAPEQLLEGQVDPRSDLFSAALVFVAMVTGWRRRSARELVPSDEVLAGIGDARIALALREALTLTVDGRIESAARFAAAFGGDDDHADVVARPPFHGLSAFTEADQHELRGRERELARLTELAMSRPLLVLTAPSGIGKTSLLRAGLVPRLIGLGVRARYLSCRGDDATALHAAMAAPGDGRVIVVDQVESALSSAAAPRAADEAEWVTALRELRPDRPGEVRIILSVREDFLARLLDLLPSRGDVPPIVRIGPLDETGARDAILRPLAERRLGVSDELLAVLLGDLAAAGARLGAELGWHGEVSIYPPHLQLVCSVLYAALPPGESVLGLPLYRGLGGFDVIVGEHLDRVLDDLAPEDAVIARDLFLALVTGAQGRSARTEAELLESLAAARDAAGARRVSDVLEVLRGQGLVVRARRDGEPVWELIHDSLVPRVLSWIDRRDLARRRAVELVRYHLRRSRPGLPSLLSRAELREVAEHAGAIAALDDEWHRQQRAAASGGWTPSKLLARSRLVRLRTTFAAVSLILLVVAGIGAAIYERRRSSDLQRAEALRRDLDLGRFAFELAPFAWDVTAQEPVPVMVADLPALSWTLHEPSFDDLDQAGEPLPPGRLRRHSPYRSADGWTRIDPAEAPGGPAFLVITGRGRRGESCPPSVIPMRSLPGYARRGAGEARLRINVPTCQATLADTVAIPAGRFVFGGLGEPPSPYQAEFPERATERIIDLPGYRIDRTEVTNAAFAQLAAMRDLTGIARPPEIPNPDLRATAEPRSPVSAVTWRDAAVYCRFLGKSLPTSEQWEKAMRGPLDDNPAPRRNFPWGNTLPPHAANLSDEEPNGIRGVGATPTDRSPYGVLDLAGNVMEWLGTPPAGTTDHAAFYRESWRIARGGNWDETPSHDLVNMTAIENARPGDTRSFTLGVRCTLPGD